MRTVQDVCKYISSKISECPVCIETGCTYVMEPGNEVHTTTNNICKYIILPKKGRLYSLDIDESHIEFASKLEDAIACKNSVFFMYGDSVRSLSLLSDRFSREGVLVDLLWLDSKEFDEWHMLAEYDAIKKCLAQEHFVLVDDIHNCNSVKYKRTVPILKSLGYRYLEVETPTGLFVASKNY